MSDQQFSETLTDAEIERRIQRDGELRDGLLQRIESLKAENERLKEDGAEYMRMIRQHESANANLTNAALKWVDQNKMMREALAYYAAPETYAIQDENIVVKAEIDADEGKKARDCLAKL